MTRKLSKQESVVLSLLAGGGTCTGIYLCRTMINMHGLDATPAGAHRTAASLCRKGLAERMERHDTREGRKVPVSYRITQLGRRASAGKTGEWAARLYPAAAAQLRRSNHVMYTIRDAEETSHDLPLLHMRAHNQQAPPRRMRQMRVRPVPQAAASPAVVRVPARKKLKPGETIMNENSKDTVHDDELRLLRSYASGPRIWDAASLMPAVFSLQEQGLTEPVPGNDSAFRLTDAGRERLHQLDGSTS
jgi:hypothetical protein